jgi:hypothetical protein
VGIYGVHVTMERPDMGNNEEAILKQKIEHRRQALYELIKSYGLKDTKIQNASQTLDSLILQYYQHKQGEQSV